ncbi:phage tail protein [Tissierella praeacuta]|uniref:phage tail protein n=1 Tax=Tissierella praeacuta TaxID=43131 RepID=UPI003DA49532
MTEQFYTILTQIGKASIANATSLGTKVEFKYFALGDGNGSYYNPTETQTSLKNEVWRGQIAQITVDEKNPNWIVLETIIPASVGGFMIREAGVFDTEGNLLAVGKYPETYKPKVENGSAKDLYIRMILEVSNTSAVTLKIDPTVILATKKDIELLEQKMDSEIEGINIPVKSVNQKTGNVVLNATDVGAETPQASQEKANKALNAAKSYTDEVAVTLTDDLNTHKNQKSSTSTVGHVQLNDTVTSTSKTLAATANAVKTAYDKAKSVEDLANGLDNKIGILNGSGEIKEKANKIDLDEHKSNASNPHRVNKSQVGLGYVENYGIATKAEAELGTINSKYMTPLRVKEAIHKTGIVSSIFSGTLPAPTSNESRSLRIPLGKIPTEFIKIYGIDSGGIVKSIGHGYIDIKTGKVFMREVYPNNSGYDWYTNKIDTVINDTSGKYMMMYMLGSYGGTYKPRLDRISLEGNELILRYHWIDDGGYNSNVKIDNLLLEVL